MAFLLSPYTTLQYMTAELIGYESVKGSTSPCRTYSKSTRCRVILGSLLRCLEQLLECSSKGLYPLLSTPIRALWRSQKPGFLFQPPVKCEWCLMEPGIIELAGSKASKGRWVHLVSLGLQVSQIQWAVMRKLPFYVRGLLREVPIALIPEVCTIAALTDPDIEVIMDQHLMLWVRSKTWSECRPFTINKQMDLGYEDSIESTVCHHRSYRNGACISFLRTTEPEGPHLFRTRPDPDDA